MNGSNEEVLHGGSLKIGLYESEFWHPPPVFKLPLTYIFFFLAYAGLYEPYNLSCNTFPTITNNRGCYDDYSCRLPYNLKDPVASLDFGHAKNFELVESSIFDAANFSGFLLYPYSYHGGTSLSFLQINNKMSCYF